MKHLYFQILWFLFSAFAGLNASAQSTWQITEATYIPIASTAPSGSVCSAYDGKVCADISHFYSFDHRMLWRFTVVGDIANNIGVRITYVTGAKAEKMTIDSRLTLGLIVAKQLDSIRSISAEIYSSLGGDTNHRPCLDAYDREYYCGDLTAWADFERKHTAYKEWGLRVMYRF